ncbi:MAG: metallo-mystery pair system four-Cys motif protein [Leptospira sp.]|nr:metallo-mystery pair system four-Cys motif protein [Leptospira sp.]
MKKLFLIIATILTLTSCNTPSNEKDNENASLLALAAIANPTAVNLDFQIKTSAGGYESNKAVTVDGRSVIFRDLRMYISEVKLIGLNDGLTDVTLTTDGIWQGNNVALIDFENGNASTGRGTAAQNSLVRGVAAGGLYKGVQFTVGVPETMNHMQSSTASAPLNVTQMYWSWTLGYKFANIEFSLDGGSNYTQFHLGSQGATGNSCTNDTITGTGNCPLKFRPRIQVTGAFNPQSQVIQIDLDQLLSGFTTAGANSCMPLGAGSFCNTLVQGFGIKGRVTTSGSLTSTDVAAGTGSVDSSITQKVFSLK